MIDKLLPIIAATAVVTGIAAAADQGKPDSAEIFKSLDRDGDQRVSKSEATGDRMLTDHFATADANGDGYITEREYSAHIKDMKMGKESKPEKPDY